MAEPIGEDERLRVRLKSLDVSDPTRAKVTFALNAVLADKTERWLADLSVIETIGMDQNNANLTINEARNGLALQLREALDHLKTEVSRGIAARI